jgi:hypothetical protein
MILSKNAENNRERFDDYRGLLRDPSEEKKTLVVDAVLSRLLLVLVEVVVLLW